MHGKKLPKSRKLPKKANCIPNDLGHKGPIFESREKFLIWAKSVKFEAISFSKYARKLFKYSNVHINKIRSNANCSRKTLPFRARLLKDKNDYLEKL